MLPMITVVGGYAGLMVVLGVYGLFSRPLLLLLVLQSVRVCLVSMNSLNVVPSHT